MTPLDQNHVQFLRNLEAKYFNDRPELAQFCLSYVMLQHLIDDIVDEEKSIDTILEAFSLGRRVWSHPIYIKHQVALDVVDELANNSYGCSEKWKTSEEQWKQVHADVLRHQGYNVFFAIIYLELGRNALNECSEHFREYSHAKHLEDFNGTFTKVAAAA